MGSWRINGHFLVARIGLLFGARMYLRAFSPTCQLAGQTLMWRKCLQVLDQRNNMLEGELLGLLLWDRRWR